MKIIGILCSIVLFLSISVCSKKELSKKNDSKYEKIESKIDSLENKIDRLEGTIASYQTSLDNNDIELLHKEAEHNINLASQIIDYSAMFFGVITLTFLIAAILGFNEIKNIRKLRKNFSKEYINILDQRKNIEESIFESTKQINLLQTNLITIISRLSEGNGAYERGEYIRAVELYKTLLLIENLPDPIISNIHFLIGKSLSAHGDYKSAEKSFSDSLIKNKENFEAYYGLALNYRNKDKQDLNEAFKCCTEALKRNKNHVGTINSMGLIYRDKNELSKALEEHMDAWQKDRNNAVTSYYIALVHLKRNQIEDAAYFFNKSLERAKTSIANRQRQHWMHHILGTFDIIINVDYEVALKNFKRGLRFNKSKMVKKAMTGHLVFISDIIIEKIGEEKYKSVLKLFQ